MQTTKFERIRKHSSRKTKFIKQTKWQIKIYYFCFLIDPKIDKSHNWFYNNPNPCHFPDFKARLFF